MIRSRGPGALVVMGEAVVICQHHLYMASSEAPMGRPRGGEMVQIRGAARARAIELIIKNPRRQYGASPTSPPYCRLRFLISFTVRRPAGPPMYGFHKDGPFRCVVQRVVCATAASVQDAWRLDPYVRDEPHTYMCISGSGVSAETSSLSRSVSIVYRVRQCSEKR